MNEEDREKMIKNCDKLLPAINWHEIWPELLEHGIFKKDDNKLARWATNLHKTENNREIYLGIINRGPNAFRSFIQCLKKIDRKDLANILQPEDSGDQVDNEMINSNPELNRNIIANINNEFIQDAVPEESDNFYTLLQHTKDPLKVNVKKSTKFMDTSTEKVPCYIMQSKPRGLVLIINNIKFDNEQPERAAAEHDEANLLNLFEQMGFKVEVSSNLTGKNMLKRIKTFSEQPELRHVHSTFVIVMSHGNERIADKCSETVISGVDHDFITVGEVLSFFTAANCPNMCNKPKAFIFQTCRGDKAQRTVQSSNVGIGRDVTDINPFASSSPSATPTSFRDYSDMLVACSTLPGHKAHRDLYTGSWYIQALCEVMMNHAYDTELTLLFKMADQRLAYLRTHSKECQTSVTSSYGFNKQCYLNPGYFAT